MTYGDIVGRFFFEAVPTMAVSPTVRFEALSAAVRQELDELWSRLRGPRA